MSQVGTNHDTAETLAGVRCACLNAESTRDLANTSFTPRRAQREDNNSRETALACAKFLAELSREMRTPLTSVLGAVEMLLDTNLSDSHKEFAQTVAESATALASMVDAIAAFSSYLASHPAQLPAHPIAPNENAPRGRDGTTHGNGSNAIASSPGASSREPQLSKTIAGGNRFGPLEASTNFKTRVPQDTARLIRILVAEDHPMNQRVMLRMLARLGYMADAVSNGVEAVAALVRNPYDIVLMDCQMPELDGYQATRQIRSNGGRFQSTPIIAVTANAMDGDREKCFASGMSDYISKPVRANTLATTLEKWILPASDRQDAPPPGERAGIPLSSQSAPAEESLVAKTEESEAVLVEAQTDAPAEASTAAPAGVSNDAPAELGDAVDPAAMETLRSMDAGDEGFLLEIIDLFLTDLTERMAAMKVAAETRDGPTLKSIAHTVKGSCGHFGATGLAALCREMGQVAVRQPVGDPRETFLRLEAEAGRVRVALEEAKRSHLKIPDHGGTG